MSTKITLYYDDVVHFYQECFNEEEVYLSIEKPSIRATVTLSLLQSAGISKSIDLESLKRQAAITDEKIAEHVKCHVINRSNKNPDLFAMFGCMVYGSPDDPQEKQIQTGIKYYTEIRDRLKKIADHLESKRTGTPMFLGLEELL